MLLMGDQRSTSIHDYVANLCSVTAITSVPVRTVAAEVMIDRAFAAEAEAKTDRAKDVK